ncbi:hypothetical protein [Tropicimonas sp. IMCC34043]|uniref:hypothetical protein n=1 Tax=Tropicimonas sp. IMCC34043 TaxID=2248760 RepID=UPI0013002DD7|nr:hypothetical protein [Tropicimonas sp. IMCC34043]
MKPMLSILAIAAMTAAAPLAVPMAEAASAIHFEKGTDHGAVTGKVTGNDDVEYTLGAKAGQKMGVTLAVDSTDGDGTVYFNITPPGGGMSIYTGSMADDPRYAEVKLPTSGNYTITVYQMGNDKDAGKTAHFSLVVTID